MQSDVPVETGGEGCILGLIVMHVSVGPDEAYALSQVKEALGVILIWRDFQSSALSMMIRVSFFPFKRIEPFGLSKTKLKIKEILRGFDHVLKDESLETELVFILDLEPGSDSDKSVEECFSKRTSVHNSSYKRWMEIR